MKVSRTTLSAWGALALLVTSGSARRPGYRLMLNIRGGGPADSSFEPSSAQDLASLARRLVEAAAALEHGSSAAVAPTTDFADGGVGHEPRVLPVAFVLDNLMRPNNVASIFATAAALGCAGGVWTAGATPQPSRVALDDRPRCGGDNDGNGSRVLHVHASTTAVAVAALREAGVAVWACDTVTLEAPNRRIEQNTRASGLSTMVSES